MARFSNWSSRPRAERRVPGTFRSIVIRAPVERVWASIRDFHDIAWAAGVLESCEKVGSRAGDQIGARRVLNGAFHERLLGLDDRRREIRYRIEEGPSPVSSSEVTDFIATARVLPVTADGGAFVSWRARWDAGTDEACDFAGGIYEALLEALARGLTE